MKKTVDSDIDREIAAASSSSGARGPGANFTPYTKPVDPKLTLADLNAKNAAFNPSPPVSRRSEKLLTPSKSRED
jgi:hypothetical protein